jgi:hypothetical protein
MMSRPDQHRNVLLDRIYWVQLNLLCAVSVQPCKSKPQSLFTGGIVIRRGQRKVLISPP